MPIDETVLATLADAARLSTAQLEGISQTVLGTALRNVSGANDPAGQIRDMIAYARQYDLTRELAAALLYTGADRPGMQNYLLGKDMVNSTDDSHGNSPHVNALDIVRLENRVGRLEDKFDAMAQKIETYLTRSPLNWSIVGWGIVLAIGAGVALWAVAVVK